MEKYKMKDVEYHQTNNGWYSTISEMQITELCKTKQECIWKTKKIIKTLNREQSQYTG